MKILIALIVLVTFALSASLAVARDANREALWELSQQQVRVERQRAEQMAQYGGQWTGSQRTFYGNTGYWTGSQRAFYGN